MFDGVPQGPPKKAEGGTSSPEGGSFEGAPAYTLGHDLSLKKCVLRFWATPWHTCMEAPTLEIIEFVEIFTRFQPAGADAGNHRVC